MSTFTFAPDYHAQKSVKPVVRTVKFGDGYSQRVAWGINSLPSMWSLTFANREDSDAQDIEEFFETLGGVDAFDWTPPGETESKRFICQEWNREVSAPNLSTITAKFEEVFEP